MLGFAQWLNEGFSRLEEALNWISKRLKGNQSKGAFFQITETASRKFGISVEILRSAFNDRRAVGHQYRIAHGGPKTPPPPEGFKATPRKEPEEPRQGSLFDVRHTHYGTTVTPRREPKPFSVEEEL